MKEITRIHIAKVSYDIETSAKKELEKYINKLELYAADSELLQDIEIRITELLAERGVTKDDVITSDDVKAVREQLGEPQDFMSDEGDIAVGAALPGGDLDRRLYRDTDGAVLGGVLSGVAKFFGINPLWIRLAFIILLFVSFGTVSLIYIVLWIAVPPARTAAEKLQLEGKSVTLGSIRELNNEAEKVVNKTPGIVKSILLIGSGVILACMALGAFLVSIGVLVVTTLFGREIFIGYMPSDYGWMAWTALGLAVAAGLLFAALASLWSYASFARRVTKRIVVASIAIIVSGLLAFGGAVGVVAAQMHYEDSYVQQHTKTKTVELPSAAAAVKTVTVSAHSAPTADGAVEDFSVQYIATNARKPQYILSSLPDVKPFISIKDDTMRVALKTSALQLRRSTIAPKLVIYGPALDTVKVEQGNFDYIVESDISPQKEVSIETLGVTRTTLSGSYDTVAIKTAGAVDVSGATVANLSVAFDGYGSVNAGVVKTLTVTQQDACPADSDPTRLRVRGVSSGEMTYNEQVMPAKTHRTACGGVVVGSEDEYDYETYEG